MLGGAAFAVDGSAEVCGFATDDRDVQPGFAFLAIRGARVDGHDFAPSVTEKGGFTICERSVAGPRIEVTNLVSALAEMARQLRDRYSGPVIGITGSAGKTTTKEFLAAVIGGKVLKTPGNRNTEYTAPLLWADVQGDEDAVVVEMSMRGFGQIAHLAAFSRPNVGLVTNIGPSHLEMVGDLAGVAKAKSELLQALPSVGFAVLPGDDEFIEDLKAATRAQIYTFGRSPYADARLEQFELTSDFRTRFWCTVMGLELECVIPVAGEHMAMNATAALLGAHVIGADLVAGAERLAEAHLPPMRMQRIDHHGSTIVLDAYNASPASMKSAIQTVLQVPAARHIGILGDMRELGSENEPAHRAIGAMVDQFDEVLFVGTSMRFAADEASRLGYSSFTLADSIEDVRGFLDTVRPGDLVLVKGSRGMELERALLPIN